MKKSVCASFIALLFGVGFADNIALNKEVNLKGSFFVGGWGGGLIADPATVTDGMLFPQSHQWDQGTIWWDANLQGSSKNSINIDLSGNFSIESFIIQVDDNDAYLIEYHDIASNTWQVAWNVPNYDYYNGINLWGMQTRPDPTNSSKQYFLSAPIVTDELRLTGNRSNSDRLFAVSEVQAFGHAVPEPSIIPLALIGIFSLLGGRLQRKKG